MATENIEVFAAGKAVFFEGEPADCMYILKEGAVELKKQTEKGEVILKTIATPNEFFGEMALIDGKPRSTSAITVMETRLILVDKTVFDSLLRTNGDFAVKIVKVLSARIRRTNVQLADTVDTRPMERIARGIADYSIRFGDRASGDARYVSKDELKTWLNGHIGAAREEIDAVIYRLKDAKRLADAETKQSKGEYLVISGDFIREHDRRREEN
ncbi:MAG TPA: Crp/Fnr family transcriptional regulator [Rectinemataceae bacterium]|nr:Crp/Fnr family transcriptional regulator [Rectinemataceae bacterium]